MSNPQHFTSIQSRKNTPDERVDIAGYIRVGEMSPGGKPKINGFFRLADTADEYIDHFNHVFGQDPVMIPIYFPTSDKDVIRIHQYEWWKDRRCFGYGDGEQFMVFDKNTQQRELTQKGSDLFNTLDAKNWKEQMTLRFKIPNFPAEGFFVLKTGGADTSIPNILRSMNYIEQSFNGCLDNMLFWLIVEMGTSKMPGNTRKFPVVKLRSAYTAEQISLLQQAFVAGDLKRDHITSYIQIQEYLDLRQEKLPKTITGRKKKPQLEQGKT